MIYLYALAVIADLWTTDRALQNPNAREAHPILSKLFGGRPSRKQFAAAAFVQSAGWLGFVILTSAPTALLLVPAFFHALAAAHNYRNGMKNGHL